MDWRRNLFSALSGALALWHCGISGENRFVSPALAQTLRGTFSAMKILMIKIWHNPSAFKFEVYRDSSLLTTVYLVQVNVPVDL